MGRKAKGIINEEGRTCIKCGEFKVWSEFSNSKSGTRGKQNKCKMCAKQNSKKYREENCDVITEYQRQYYEENRDVKLEQQRRYYEENRDAKLEYQRQYREDNRDVIAEYQKQYKTSPAKYEIYKDQLTPFESPRETVDGYLEVRCATCREYFTPTNQQVQNRIKALKENKRENRLYCSNACKESCSVYKKVNTPRDSKNLQTESTNQNLEL
jgi:hypothetical protein